MRVCIFGSGLSALTLAKALVNLKIYIDLIPSKKKIEKNQTRTIGISKTNIEFFNKDIINIKKILWKLEKIEIFSENLKNEKMINFNNEKNHLFSILKNHELEKILNKTLLTNKFFKKINTIKEKNFDKSYDLIINTDYYNFFSKKYFNRKIIKKYNSYAYTTTIQHQKIKNNIASQIFTKKGPLAFLPVSNYETSIVYSIYNEINDKNENINKLINYYNFKYKIKKINKINKFELNGLHLRSYYHNNILAFGDLLHKIHPLAGQGFNMTIRDIRNLKKIITNKISLGLPLDKSVNIEFEKNFRHTNFIFSSSIDLIQGFFDIERKTKNKVLSRSAKLLAKNPLINKMLTKIADKGIAL